jgi:hypothetical protein
MRGNQRLLAAAALATALVSAAMVTPGCSGEQSKTGTSVERTPEQDAAEQASIDGMRKAMMQQQKAKGQPK